MKFFPRHIARARHFLPALLLATLTTCCLRADTYYVIVAGLGGSPEYETQFEKWAAELDRNLRSNGPDAHVTMLCGPAATRPRIEQALAEISETARPDDAFALFLIGHGTFDGTDYKFNIPGPDLTAAALASAANRIPARRQLIVNMTSSSGASLAPLAKKDRIVITATKSGNERNATVFARYWVDALTDPAADADKNGSISALEAFRYAERKTAAYFESEKLLATEHALVTDTGSPNAARDPKPENGQGALAAAFPVLRPRAATAIAAAPDKQKLVAKKEDLEARIDRLKYQKSALSPDDYKKQMSALLLDLARTQAEIDR